MINYSAKKKGKILKICPFTQNVENFYLLK